MYYHLQTWKVHDGRFCGHTHCLLMVILIVKVIVVVVVVDKLSHFDDASSEVLPHSTNCTELTWRVVSTI